MVEVLHMLATQAFLPHYCVSLKAPPLPPQTFSFPFTSLACDSVVNSSQKAARHVELQTKRLIDSFSPQSRVSPSKCGSNVYVVVMYSRSDHVKKILECCHGHQGREKKGMLTCKRKNNLNRGKN